MWALEVLNCNYSFNSCAIKGKLFNITFADNDIAKNFIMASIETNYIVYYGLAPYFKEMLLDNLSEVIHIVPCFDELYNSVIKKCQMDVLVRYWDVSLNKVNTSYFSSEFMGKATADYVLAKFESASSELDKSISSNGPNVNLKFLCLLNEKRRMKF